MHLNGEIHTDLPEDERLSCYGGLKMMLFVYMEQTLQRRDDYALTDVPFHAMMPR